MNVYSYFGHAGDICISTGDLKLATVPKHCTYVARTGCGLVALVNQTFGNLLVDPTIHNALQNPFQSSNKQTIEAFLDEEIEIHTENTEIVESMYNPLGLYSGKGNTFTIFLSGLRNAESFETFPKRGGKLNYPFQNFPKGSRVPKEVIVQSFEGAIYPTQATIRKTFVKDSYSEQELESIAKELKRSTVELMKQYPGVHYNLLCRSVHESCTKAAIKRRLISAYKFDTQFDTLQRTLLHEENEKNIEAFLQQLPEAFYENVDMASLMKLQAKLPTNRKKYIQYIVNKYHTLFPEKRKTPCLPGQVRNPNTKLCEGTRKRETKEKTKKAEKAKTKKRLTPILEEKEKEKKTKPTRKIHACPSGYRWSETRKRCRKQKKPGAFSQFMQYMKHILKEK